MDKWKKWLEVGANVAIVCVCVLIIVIGVKRYLMPTPNADLAGPAKGTHLALAGVDWNHANRSLVMVLSTQCHFCSESAEFYKKLLPEASDRKIQVVALLPQSPEESRQYLTHLGLSISNVAVQQEQAATVHVAGTPTLILVDNKGLVVRSWAGKLPAPGEEEVLSQIN